MRILTVLGARPQIIKASALNRVIKRDFSGKLEEIILHTGQHYDPGMSGQFFRELEIDEPAFNLEVGSASHAFQTAKMLEGIEQVIQKIHPNAVLVYGDTNSTLAGALVSAKMHIPVIHVEAGLRSFNKAMPEEINRITCDHMSTLLFTPTLAGLENLKNEGFKLHHEHRATASHPKVFHCGDIMYDNSLFFAQKSTEQSTIVQELGLEKSSFALCTIHRAENTDDPARLGGIFEALCDVADSRNTQIILPLHPRTKNCLRQHLSQQLFHRLEHNEKVRIIEPLGFMDIIALEKHARIILTDSGGVQKEAYFFRKPCLIFRDQTEWTELVETGHARLAGYQTADVLSAFDSLLSADNLHFPPLFGDGRAAQFICEKILSELA
jgi:UDP-GlcNAc3NAcA epimerase